MIGDYGRRVLKLAGVTDVWSRSSGQTRSTINFARATYNALEELSRAKLSDEIREGCTSPWGGESHDIPGN